MSKVKYEVEGGALNVGLDYNEDGEKSLNAKLFLNEVIGELVAKGEAKEDVKVTSFKFELPKLIVVIDTDKDGENLLELELDVMEALQEAKLTE